MNTLILLAALSAGQCSDSVCVVTVEAIVIPAAPAPVRGYHVEGQRIAQLRRTVAAVRATVRAKPVRTFFRNQRPLRRFIRSRPLLRSGRRVLGRGCR